MPKRLKKGGALSAVVMACLFAGAVRTSAQTGTPAPDWSNQDVGNPALQGSATLSNSTWTVKGGGANIWATSDEFQFVYQAISGDVDISARVTAFDPTNQFGKAGLMIRESLAANAKNAFVMISPGTGAAFQRRTTTGGSTSRTVNGSGNAPMWLRLVRSGSQFTAYRSTDGTAWTSIGSATISMASSIYVGMAVTNRDAGALATATVTTYKVTKSGLPTPWQNRDIGSPAVTGSASVSAGVFTVGGGGVDIWDASDQFQYVYQPIQGDTEIIARVNSIGQADPYSKGGIMIRESLAAGARHATVFSTAVNGWRFSVREQTNGSTFSVVGPSSNAPGWARLTRTGNVFNAYWSSDGVTWSLIGTDTVTMTSAIYVGLAATSHNPSTKSTDIFSNVTVRTPTVNNNPPAVSITSPSNGASFAAGATISIAANASDSDGTVSKVDLYQGSTLLKSDNTSPYSLSWTGMSAGTYQLTAVATDDKGATTTSSTVTVTVGSATNQPPSVSVTSPAAGASFTAGQNITIRASASDTDGTVSRVEFYRGTTLIGTDTTSPYSATWSNSTSGSYTITAKAFDDDGASRTSAGVNISVSTATNSLPTVSITGPSAGARFTAPASVTITASASDSDGTIAGVDFYVGSLMIGTDTTAPYSAAWTNVAAGTYSLTAVARDNAGGSKTSGAVAVTVNGVTSTPTKVVFVPSTDNTGNVSSYTLAVYRSTDALTASPVATKDLGKPSIVNGEMTVDVSTTIDPLAAGSYKAVVRAVGPGGTTASAPSANFTK